MSKISKQALVQFFLQPFHLSNNNLSFQCQVLYQCVVYQGPFFWSDFCFKMVPNDTTPKVQKKEITKRKESPHQILFIFINSLQTFFILSRSCGHITNREQVTSHYGRFYQPFNTEPTLKNQKIKNECLKIVFSYIKFCLLKNLNIN